MNVLRRAELTERDGVLLREERASDYRQRWEDEAAADHVCSAIARPSAGAEDFDTLTGKVSPLWQRFPTGRRVGTLLDVGCGYGRIELWLSREKALRCDTFCAVDISETMLRRLIGYRERFDVFPDAVVHPIRASADALPIADASVDLVVSSAVFLHMGKSFVARTLAEIARVLRPGGGFVFDTCFPNALNPTHIPPRLKLRRMRTPNALKYWRAREVATLIRSSGLADRAGSFHVEPAGFALLPKRVGPLGVPLARRLNDVVGDGGRRLDGVLATSFSAYSDGTLA